jgi:hypothetical protein
MSNKFSTTTLNIPKDLYIVTGGISGGSKTEWESLSDSFFAKRIPETQKHFIANINTWQPNVVYNKYVSIDNYDIVFNSENQTVYLCLHNHVDYRDDLEPGLSTEQPSHTSGRQLYSDGYTWLPLFKVDFTEWEFISAGEIPIPKLNTKNDYNNFIEKYEPLCGSHGTTSFGCCCLYFKENLIDEVTGEIYSSGDLTNESIFSDCYECQKIADTLDRDVLFYSGVLPSGITLSHPLENPLCPETKTINTLQTTLEEQKYNIVPGSSKEYQLTLLNNHNNNGIMAISLDLSNLTDSQRTISQSNPTINVVDPSGSGAVVRLKTQAVGLNSHIIYGAELVSEGTGYGELPIVDANQSIINKLLQPRIILHTYPKDIYTNPQRYAKPYKIKISEIVYDSEITSVLPGEFIHNKFAVMADPLLLSSNSPTIYTENDSSVQNLLTTVILYKPSTVVNEELIIDDPNPVAFFDTEFVVSSNGYWGQYVGATTEDGWVYLNASRTTKAEGFKFYLNDEPDTYTTGSIVTYGGTTYTVGPITKPTLNVKTANFFNVTDTSTNPIGGKTGPNTTKGTVFNISINLI